MNHIANMGAPNNCEDGGHSSPLIDLLRQPADHSRTKMQPDDGTPTEPVLQGYLAERGEVSRADPLSCASVFRRFNLKVPIIAVGAPPVDVNILAIRIPVSKMLRI